VTVSEDVAGKLNKLEVVRQVLLGLIKCELEIKDLSGHHVTARGPLAIVVAFIAFVLWLFFSPR
jgi:hypothetical protein